MANIKDLGKSAAKWSARASVATGDYTSGVQNPRRPWAEAAAAGAENYKAGVIAAANEGRFGAGVRMAGNQRWTENTQLKGPSRFAEGVSQGAPAWERGFKPYQEAISKLQLPPRGPKGSPGNLQRVAVVAQANRDLKLKLGK